MANKAKNNSEKKAKWNDLCVLIVDEISMLADSLFMKLEYTARIVRENEKPFGGVQLIFSGDFFQLPPVKAKFSFEVDTWKDCKLNPHILTEVIRQKGDLTYVNLLNNFRTGHINKSDIDILNACHERNREPFEIDGIEPTKLYVASESRANERKPCE